MTAVFLVQPPAEMRDACCEGLTARAEAGRGGTARSVPFATRVCAGGPIERSDLVDMLTHMAAIENEMESRLGDPALEVAWRLWGGDAGREWAEQFVTRWTDGGWFMPFDALPMAAALDDGVDDDSVATAWATELNALARSERELRARIHELCEAGLEVALSKVHAKVIQALARPSQALRSALGGLDRRDAVLAAMRDHDDPAHSLACVPGPLMAKLGPSAAERELLLALFRQHTVSRASQLIEAHQAAVAQVIDDAAGDPAVSADLRANFQLSLGRAMVMLTDALFDLAARFMTNPHPLDDEEGEVPTGRVPGSIAYLVLSACGGGDERQPDVQDWAKVGGGDLLASGVALGVHALRTLDQLTTAHVLAAAPVKMTVTSVPEMKVTTRTVWHWGGAARPFPPHVALNGRSWTTEAERQTVTRNTASFPRGPYFTPGDHIGCSCSYEVELIIKQVKAGAATATVASEESAEARGLTQLEVDKQFSRKVAFGEVHPDGTPRKLGEPARPGKTTPAQRRAIVQGTGATATPAPRTVIKGVTIRPKLAFSDDATEVTLWPHLHEDPPVEKLFAAQVTNMTDQLRVFARPPGAPSNIVRITVKHDMPKGVKGQALVGRDQIAISSEAKTTRVATSEAGHWARNAEKLTEVEYVTVHEWGHLIDTLDQDRSARLFRRATNDVATGKHEWVSKYGASNGREMVAESFIDFMADPATASPMAKWVAQELGWPEPPTPLARLSALNKGGKRG